MTTFWEDIKKDMKWAVAITVLIMGYAFCGEADAQVITQPVYTRPAKGAVLTVFNATVSPNTVTSQAYDWTAFSAAGVSLKLAKADGTRCPCPSGVDNCMAAFTLGIQSSTSKTGPFGEIVRSSTTAPIFYTPSAPVTQPAILDAGQYNITDPFVQFFGDFTDYKDTGTGMQVAGCFMTITVTPIPFSNRHLVEGPYKGFLDSLSQVSPVMMGGADYNPPGGSGSGSGLAILRVNPLGTVAVGYGSGDPLLPATSPVSVNAATLVYTATVNQRGVRLQNVGANPALCAAGANAASVAAGRYSFALAAAATAGAGGTYDVQQLDSRNSAANGKVYCLGSGGATSIAILPY